MYYFEFRAPPGQHFILGHGSAQQNTNLQPLVQTFEIDQAVEAGQCLKNGGWKNLLPFKCSPASSPEPKSIVLMSKLVCTMNSDFENMPPDVVHSPAFQI